jgi:hypothetical protein
MTPGGFICLFWCFFWIEFAAACALAFREINKFHRQSFFSLVESLVEGLPRFAGLFVRAKNCV